MSSRLKKNIQAFGLLGLSILLGTGTSEAIHQWLDRRGNEAIHQQSVHEATHAESDRAVSLNQIPKD